MATVDLGRITLVPKGAWSGSTAYERLDVVTSGGNSYMAKTAVAAGTALSSADHWQLIAEKGGQGDPGENGTAGDWADLTGVPATFAPSAHNQAWGTITATPTTLAGYGISDAATAAQGALAASASQPGHTHAQSDVTGLVAALAGKAATVHTHAIADVTGLQTALDGKQAAGSYATAAQGALADTAVQPAGLSVKQDTLVSGTNIKTVNGNSLLGAGDLEISGGGAVGPVLTLANQSAKPAVPDAGNLQVYSRDRAGTGWLEVQRPSGRDFPLQPHIGVNRVSTWAPSTGTTVIVTGVPRTVVGTASHPAPSSANFAGTLRKWRVTSAATANAVANERSAAAFCSRGAAGYGGWTYINRFHLSAIQAASVAYFGMSATTGALATTQTLVGLTNVIGIGFTNGTHANWQLVHNGYGAPTVIDMGTDFAIAVNRVLTLYITASPNASSVWVRLVDEESGASFEAEITTKLPDASMFLTVQHYLSNGGAAAAVSYDCSGLYLETDY